MRCAVCGARGYTRLPPGPSPHLSANRAPRTEHRLREEEDYFRPGRHTPTNTTYRWIEAICTGQTAVSPSLEDGWRSQQVIDAVIQASAERRWVDVM